MGTGLLCRRGEAMQMLGVGRRAFEKLVSAGVLQPRYLGKTGREKRGRAVYVRSEVERVGGGK